MVIGYWDSLFQAEVDRLRKEGSRLLQEEQDRLKQKLQVT